MALSNIFGWSKKQEAAPASASCGSACGAGDKEAEKTEAEKKPTACGSACGASSK